MYIHLWLTVEISGVEIKLVYTVSYRFIQHDHAQAQFLNLTQRNVYLSTHRILALNP